MTAATEVVIVDDHDLVREGLRSLLGRYDDIAVVGEAGSVDDALTVVHSTDPDLVLLDLGLGDEDGAEVARRLRSTGVGVRILVLSSHDTTDALRRALAAGVDGYLLKSVSAAGLADGIRAAAAGRTVIGEEFLPKLLADVAGGGPVTLTGREHEVLGMVAEGLGNRDLAARLGISPRTAQKHVENLFRKLDVHDRGNLVAQATRRGLLA